MGHRDGGLAPLSCATIEVKVQPDAAIPRGPICEGCTHNWYSAPGGQAWDRTPHSRCLYLKANIPMVVDKHGSWRSSAIPAGCPTHAQGALFA